jgi:hypothetical protein
MLTGQDHSGNIMKSPIKVTALVVLVVFNFFLIRHGIRAAEEQIYEGESFNNAIELNRATFDQFDNLTDASMNWDHLNSPEGFWEELVVPNL